MEWDIHTLIDPPECRTQILVTRWTSSLEMEGVQMPPPLSGRGSPSPVGVYFGNNCSVSGNDATDDDKGKEGKGKEDDSYFHKDDCDYESEDIDGDISDEDYSDDDQRHEMYN
jgi:hypothetical protein